MNRKLLLLSIIFLFTTVFIHGRGTVKGVNKPSVRGYFEQIKGYRLIQYVEMEKSALELLKLDDYLYADYADGDGIITLYIGYYYTADKASAAHSPLICYPSQGWKIESREPGESLDIERYVIHYNEIITSVADRKELVLYWFQAGHETNTEAFTNKTSVAINKLTGKGEQHAFVRVSVNLGNSEQEQVKHRALQFIEAFYPQFIGFIDAQ